MTAAILVVAAALLLAAAATWWAMRPHPSCGWRGPEDIPLALGMLLGFASFVFLMFAVSLPALRSLGYL